MSLHVRGYTLHQVHSLRTPERQVTYYADLWTQPLHRWLAATAYHRYDMTMYRLPGFRRVENWLLAWQERRHGDIAIPWGANMDCRCYLLTQRDRTVLATVEIDEQTYRQAARR